MIFQFSVQIPNRESISDSKYLPICGISYAGSTLLGPTNRTQRPEFHVSVAFKEFFKQDCYHNVA